MGVKKLPHLQYVRGARVAVVLSCPGEAEAQAGHPAAGPTGFNLELLLRELSARFGSAFERRKVTITNAWPEVFSIKRNGRTEAPDELIREPRNLDRLREELRGIRIVIASGRKAELAMHRLRILEMAESCFVIPHLGRKGLARVPGENNAEKIECLSTFISNALKEPGWHRFINPHMAQGRAFRYSRGSFEDTLLKKIGVEPDVLLRFLLFYSRLEFALKFTAYARQERHMIKIETSRFVAENAVDLDQNGARSADYLRAKEFLLTAQPRGQVIDAERGLIWQDTEFERRAADWNGIQREYFRLAEIVKLLRNNLFHGGKYHNPDLLENRNDELLRAGITVIASWSEHPGIIGYFRDF
jgi:hypothetical protein